MMRGASRTGTVTTKDKKKVQYEEEEPEGSAFALTQVKIEKK